MNYLNLAFSRNLKAFYLHVYLYRDTLVERFVLLQQLAIENPDFQTFSDDHLTICSP